MKNDNTKNIDRYLLKEMSETERSKFEQELTNNPELKTELELQQSIYEAAQRQSFRNTVKKTAKSYHFTQWMKWVGLGLVVIGALATALMLSFENESSVNKDNLEIEEDLISDTPGLIENLAKQEFLWEGKDTIFVSSDGVIVSVPKNALLKDNQPYAGDAIVEWQEAIDGASIMKAGLSTMADSNLLETQGMFSLRITDTEGNLLEVNPDVGIYVQAPVDEYKTGMQLYDGEFDTDSIINWVNPVPLEKIPVPVPMSELDFYPEGYEDTLDELKLRQDKKFRDSLYLACEPVNSFDSYSGKELFHGLCAVCHHPRKDLTGPKLQNVRKKWRDGGAFQESIYQWVQNWEKPAKKDEYANQVSKWSPTAMSKFEYLSKNNIRKIFDYVDNEYNENDKPEREKTQEVFSLSQKKDGKEPTSFFGEIIKGKELNNLVNTEATLIYNRYEGSYEIIVDVLLNSDHLFLSDSENNVLTLESLNKSSEIKYITPTQIYSEGRRLINVDQFQANELKGKHRLIRKFRFGGGKLKKPISFEFTFILCNSKGECHLRNQVIKFNPKTEIFKHIPPSKVLSFWNSKFDNTLLATREFERRMQSLHGICKERLLDLYMNNLDKPLWFTDSLIMAKGHQQFEDYFAERVGEMEIENSHLKGLKKFFENEIDKLRNRMKKEREAEREKERVWDKNVTNERQKEGIRKTAREAQAYSEEVDLNHQRTSRQLGFTQGFILRSNVRIVNIDKEVYQATRERKTTTVEFEGKSSTIQYNDFSFSVKNHSDYKQLYTYLLPDKLNSYQRIRGENGVFDYPLNNEINYKAVVLGINERGYFYKELLQIGELTKGEISLRQISENAFDKRIKELNNGRLDAPMQILDELNWLRLEKENYKVQLQRKERRKFLERMRRVVFPCYEKQIYNEDNESVSNESEPKYIGI